MYDLYLDNSELYPGIFFKLQAAKQGKLQIVEICKSLTYAHCYLNTYYN